MTNINRTKSLSSFFDRVMAACGCGAPLSMLDHSWAGKLLRSRWPATVLAAAPLAALASVPLGRPAVEASPAPNSASELIAEVNALRAANGMGPLNVDPILMSIAQAQNNYSMSIGQITHTGPDGSRPKERAIAAGYGGGATVFVSENIAEGTGLTPAEAVQWWTGDDPHWNTMMGANYRDIGAGAGCDGNTCYYTIDTGYVAGGISANSTAPAAVPAAPVSGGAMPVLQATPLPDGSVVHTVQAGQTLVDRGRRLRYHLGRPACAQWIDGDLAAASWRRAVDPCRCRPDADRYASAHEHTPCHRDPNQFRNGLGDNGDPRTGTTNCPAR